MEIQDSLKRNVPENNRKDAVLLKNQYPDKTNFRMWLLRYFLIPKQHVMDSYNAYGISHNNLYFSLKWKNTLSFLHYIQLNRVGFCFAHETEHFLLPLPTAPAEMLPLSTGHEDQQKKISPPLPHTPPPHWKGPPASRRLPYDIYLIILFSQPFNVG